MRLIAYELISLLARISVDGVGLSFRFGSGSADSVSGSYSSWLWVDAGDSFADRFLENLLAFVHSVAPKGIVASSIIDSSFSLQAGWLESRSTCT